MLGSLSIAWYRREIFDKPTAGWIRTPKGEVVLLLAEGGAGRRIADVAFEAPDRPVQGFDGAVSR